MRNLSSSAFGGSDSSPLVAPPSIEPSPTRVQYSRYLDPTTGDYSATSDGFAVMSPRTQQVVIALTTAQGSIPQNPTFGLRMPAKVTDSFTADVDTAVRSALAHITGLQILGVVVEQSSALSSRYLITVSFRDTVTGREDSTSVGITL